MQFGPLGIQEILIILALALIVFGPRRLPQLGRALGRTLEEFRRGAHDLRSSLEREVRIEDQAADDEEIREGASTPSTHTSEPDGSEATEGVTD